MKLFLAFLVMFGYCVIGCQSSDTSDDLTTSTTLLKRVDTPFREHGYSQLASQLITSSSQLSHFLEEIASQENWNNKKAFLEVVSDKMIDFSQWNLLFYRLTEPSGSIVLTVSSEIYHSNENRIEIIITRQVPQMGTADMAYYALVYLINKSVASITIDNGVQKADIRNEQSDMIIPRN